LRPSVVLAGLVLGAGATPATVDDVGAVNILK
jgi:hypothetical protein